MTMSDKGEGLVERLREAHANSQQRVLGSNIFAEAADRITALQAEVGRLTEANEALMRERTSLIETKREQLARAGAEYDKVLNSYADENQSFSDRIEALSAKLKLAEAALEPFAEAIVAYDAFWAEETGGQDHLQNEDEEKVTFFSLGSDVDMVPLSAFRRARAALSEQKP